MDVCVRRPGKLEMNDMVDRWDIQPTSSDVRSDEDAGFGGSESIKVLETLFLLQLGVEREDGNAECFKERDETSNTVDRTDENE